MKVKILYFGMIHEKTGCSQESLEFVALPENIGTLVQQLTKKYPELDKEQFQISCGKQLVTTDYTFKDGDEIALLPPFSGG